MRFTVAIDISTFVWDSESFQGSNYHYYKLLSIVPTVFEQIQKLKLPVLLRNDLFENIISEFPFVSIDDMGCSYFSTQTLRFLTNNKWSVYHESKENGFTTNPELVKDHFNQNIKDESNYQVVHLFNDVPNHKFIAYEYFHDTKTNLSINKNKDEKVEIDTLYYSAEQEVIDFFEKFKIKFEHNPKHDMYKSGGKISPLSCYNEREGDTSKAQKLLDKAFLHEGHYYNFDKENGVLVRFILTKELLYHAHDLKSDELNIPNAVTKKFSKNGK